MNRRIDIDMEVQWPLAKSVEKTSVLQLESKRVMQHTQTSKRPAKIEQAIGAEVKIYGSSELFEGAKEVGIHHAGSVYRLKITRQGKLILNK